MSPMFAPATDQAEYELPEPDRYIANCVDIEDAPDKGFGAGVKWVFKLVHAATGQTVQKKDGGDLLLWQWTSTKMSPKARARPIIEALMGRPLEDGERPDSRKLLGKAMVTLLIHEPGENGIRARLTSCKPYEATGMVSPTTSTLPPRPGFDTQGSPVDTAALLDLVKKAIRKTEILQTPKHLDWLALEVEKLDHDELEAVLAAVNQDVALA